MNWTKLLLIFAAARTVLDLFNKPQIAEKLKEGLIEAENEKEVKYAIWNSVASAVDEAIATGLQPGTIEGLVEAKSGDEVDAVLNKPEVKAGLLEVIGRIVSDLLGTVSALLAGLG